MIRTITASIGLAVMTSINAQDVKSLGMGGVGVTSGQGVNGVIKNPALLSKHQQTGKTGSFNVGASVGFNQQAKKLGDIDVYKTYSSLNAEADKLNNSRLEVACLTLNPAGLADDTVCLKGLLPLRNSANKMQAVLNDADFEQAKVQAQARLGFSYLKTQLPFAFNIKSTALLQLTPDISEKDQQLLSKISQHSGAKNELTVLDIKNNRDRVIINTNGTVSIKNLKNEKLASKVTGLGVLSHEISASTAQHYRVRSHDVFVGLSPKIVQLNVSDIKQTANSNTKFDLKKQLKDTQTSVTKFSSDIGVLMENNNIKGLKYALTVDDVIPYETTSKNGTIVATEPQVTAGIGYETPEFTVAMDAGLNQADKLGKPKQNIALGAEYRYEWLGVRTGISKNIADKDEKLTYALGATFGFFDVGVGLSSDNTQIAMQFASDF